MMGIGTYWAIYAGCILGVLARSLLGNNKAGLIGFMLPVAIGVGGSFGLDEAGQLFGLYGPDQLAGFIAGVVGAVLLLAGWRAYDRKKTAAA